MTRATLALLVVLTAVSARAAVEETTSMADALAGAGPGTLVVLDIDNTLLEPVSYVGGDAWYELLVQRAMTERRLSRTAAIDHAMVAWNDAQYVIDVKTVEATTPDAVRRAQASGAQVIALTARTPDIAPRTLAQLASADIAFEQPSAPVALPPGTLLQGGVLFVGDHHDKGEMLVALMKELKLRPQRVVFVDDKPKHAAAVDRALAKAGVPCRSFRYGAADAKVAAFWRDFGDVAFFLDGAASVETKARIDRAKSAR